MKAERQSPHQWSHPFLAYPESEINANNCFLLLFFFTICFTCNIDCFGQADNLSLFLCKVSLSECWITRCLSVYRWCWHAVHDDVMRIVSAIVMRMMMDMILIMMTIRMQMNKWWWKWLLGLWALLAYPFSLKIQLLSSYWSQNQISPAEYQIYLRYAFLHSWISLFLNWKKTARSFLRWGYCW